MIYTNLFTILLYGFSLGFFILGIAVTHLVRFLRRLGATRFVELDPATETFQERYVRVGKDTVKLKRGKEKASVPVSLGTPFMKDGEAIHEEHIHTDQPDGTTTCKIVKSKQQRGYLNRLIGNRLFIVDATAGLAMTIERKASRLVHPNGFTLRKWAESLFVKQFNENEGQNNNALIVCALVAVIIVAVMVGFVLVKLAGLAAAMNHG